MFIYLSNQVWEMIVSLAECESGDDGRVDWNLKIQNQFKNMLPLINFNHMVGINDRNEIK